MGLIIRNGTIVDGTGAPPYRGDLRIRNGRIDEISASLTAAEDDEEFRADGLYVSPGFIDAHSHNDLAAFSEEGYRPKLLQGISTEVVGQCGFSPAPVPVERQQGWLSYYVAGSPLDAWEWETTAEFHHTLRQRGLELNLLPFTGHGALRFAVAGDSPAALTEAQRREEQELLARSFEEGAGGLSLGLIYVPALFADREELRGLMRVAAGYGKITAVHMRSESDELIEAFEEMASLHEETGARLHISHVKAIGLRNQHKMELLLERIERHDLSFDMYPYPYGSTSLLSMLPPSLFEGNTAKKAIAQLESPEVRSRIERLYRGEERPAEGMPWDNLPQLVGWEQIEIAEIPEGPDGELVGLPFPEAAERRGTSCASLLFELVEKYGGRAKYLDLFSSEETVRKAALYPNGVFGTDSLIGGKPHPRIYGTFPKILQDYVFRRRLLSIEEMIRKMTGKAAEILDLEQRGTLVPGAAADVAVFGEEFTDREDRRQPEKPAEGLRLLTVNGVPKVLDSSLRTNGSARYPGMLLKT